MRKWGVLPRCPRVTNVAAFKEALVNGVNIRSITFGYKHFHGEYCRTPNIRADTLNKKYCEDVKFIVAWGKRMLRDDFTFSDVIILQDSECPVHADTNNLGESAILTLGNFEGGGLWVSDGEGGKVLECHNTVHYFDGKTPHATMPFQGQRFTLVFYTRREVPSAKPGVRATLTELGFPLPPTGEWLTDTTTPEAVVKDAEREFDTFKSEWGAMSKVEQWKRRRGVSTKVRR